MSGNRVVVVGATGMVGGLVLRHALESPNVESVLTVGRRITGQEHEKLQERVHADFSDCAPIADALEDFDAAIFCLGTYTGTVPGAEFRKITVDYVVEFARTLVVRSPGATFCLLSGQGADRTEKSRIAFARYKGAAENQLLELGFPRVHVFRPGYIYPVTPRDEPNLSYRVLRWLYPLLRRVYPDIGISSDDLARAMLGAALDTDGELRETLENRDIRAWAAKLATR